jgi:hypothetical protein
LKEFYPILQPLYNRFPRFARELYKRVWRRRDDRTSFGHSVGPRLAFLVVPVKVHLFSSSRGYWRTRPLKTAMPPLARNSLHSDAIISM